MTFGHIISLIAVLIQCASVLVLRKPYFPEPTKIPNTGQAFLYRRFNRRHQWLIWQDEYIISDFVGSHPVGISLNMGTYLAFGASFYTLRCLAT
ncbi:MAG: hypothetical protein RIC35_16770 [Marinoscillum sp.]